MDPWSEGQDHLDLHPVVRRAGLSRPIDWTGTALVGLPLGRDPDHHDHGTVRWDGRDELDCAVRSLGSPLNLAKYDPHRPGAAV